MNLTISRKAHFNAAHKLYRPDWSDKKNESVFGKCANENFHGHNYDLTVSLTGKVNPETGYVYDLGKLKDIIKQEVEDYLDHKNLNLDIPEFKNLNPTAENIAILIYDRLINHFKPDYKLKMNVLNLQHHWSPLLTEELAKEDLVIDLLPQVHRKAYKAGKNVVRIDFSVITKGKKTAAGHFGKAGKGELIKYIATNQITDVKGLADFEYDGFHWDKKLNTFVKET